MRKIALLVEEFYDKDLGGYGGYGILAREYVAKYLPTENIEVEVIIGSNKSRKIKTITRDGTKIHYLPKKWSSKYDIDFIYKNKVKKFLKNANFDVYISIEMSKIAYEVMKIEENKKLILWIQDPRPKSDWEEIKSVPMSSEYDSYLNYYMKWEDKIQKLLKKLSVQNRLCLISQGKFLMHKAKELYKIENNEIEYVPNPVEINDNFKIEKKENSIIFLGRMTAVKRPWLFFEIAKNMPEYNFYACGQGELLHKAKEEYKEVKNLKFMGHVSGEEKEQLLSKCKIMINTSIHEAIPVSFLEAISYGCYIVSCQNPDEITSDYGYWSGTVLGDGVDSLDKFMYGTKYCIENYNENKIREGIEYIKNNHSIEKFKKTLKKVIESNI